MSQAESFDAPAKRSQRDMKRRRNLSEMRRRANGVFVTMSVLFVSGCGAARPFKYYQLSVSSDLGSAVRPDPFPFTLIVGRMKASHLYREDRIVYSTIGEEMGSYEYQRWTEPPTEMIEESLLRALRASGQYKGVYSLGSETRGDFLLRGQLFDFKEVSGEALLARLTLDLELRDTKSGATVWTHYYAHDEPVVGKDVSAVVAALNRNVQRFVTEVRASLEEYFRSNSSKQSAFVGRFHGLGSTAMARSSGGCS